MTYYCLYLHPLYVLSVGI